jgi:hypothetical protein
LFAASSAGAASYARDATFGSDGSTRPRILILEKSRAPGRKFLLSGAGQCNLTHSGSVEDFLPHYSGGPKPGSAGRFLKPSLYAFGPRDLLEWFRARGHEFETEENGKIFPVKRKAQALLDSLVGAATENGATLRSSRRVSGIRHEEIPGEGVVFTIAVEVATAPEDSDSVETYRAKRLLITTGGASYPGTGSTGDGFTLAASLGHGIVQPKPALAPIYIEDFRLADHAGLSFKDAGLVVKRGGAQILNRTGDLLITHQGLSGPLVLDASAAMEKGDAVEIRFSTLSAGQFRTSLEALVAANPRKAVRNIVPELGLPKALAESLCLMAGFGPEDRAADAPRAKREKLCALACAHALRIQRVGGFELAMATAGGVALSEVNPSTMESRLVPGLFFAGETLDFVGDTGGYNLQAAFSTAFAAARGLFARN